MTPAELAEDYNWCAAFAYARRSGNPITREVKDFAIEDVVEVLACADGENEGPDWVGLFAFLKAGCDYTGWDCQAGGAGEWTTDRDSLVACIPDEDRERLGLTPKGGAR